MFYSFKSSYSNLVPINIFIFEIVKTYLSDFKETSKNEQKQAFSFFHCYRWMFFSESVRGNLYVVI